MSAMQNGYAYDFNNLVQEDRVHRLVYTDPNIFELELKKIFGNTWIFIGHESEVPNAGDFKTAYIGRQPVIFSRGDDGECHVLYNRCSHRGALLTREERGHASRFMCIYHGWTYDMCGRLIGVPFAEAYGEHFNMDEFGLGRIPRWESYRGFFFASLKSDIEPLEQYLGRGKPYLDLIIDRSPEGEIEITRRGLEKYAYPGNWKLLMENWTDSYHPSFTHEAFFGQLQKRTGVKGVRADGGSEIVDLGHGHTMIDYAAAIEARKVVGGKIDQEHLALLAKRLGQEDAERVLTNSNMNLNFYPNMLFRSDTQGFQIIRPVRVDYTEVFYHAYRLKGAPPAQQNRFVQKPGANAGSPIQTDDMEAYERIQEGLAVEGMEWTIFSRGMHRERVMPNGEVRGLGTDEVGHRGQHREWKRLMTLES